MFNVDDLVIYGTNGVCRVTGITSFDINDNGGSQSYYVLKPLYQECVISTPVNNTRVFMRPIISKEYAEKVINMIPTMHVEIYHSHILRELIDHYEVAVRSNDCKKLIEITMSIYAKRQAAIQQGRKLGAIDEKFMKRAEDLLFGELGAALGIHKDDVPAYISAKLEGKIGEDMKRPE